MPPEPSADTVAAPGIPFTPHQYHQAYELRRQRSTMAAEARTWLCAHAPSWMVGRRPLRILSVGCGDGNLDLPMLAVLEGLGPVDYTGIDVNAASLEVFRAHLADRPATLLNADVAALPADTEPFDVVLVSHMLYYVEHPAELVSRLLRTLTRTDGRVVVIHSAYRGIPELMDAVDGLTPFLTAQDIAAGLTQVGLDPTWHMLHTELDATEVLAATPQGRAVLEFCIETELHTLSPTAQAQLQAELTTRCLMTQGRAVLVEEVAVLEVRNPLREVPAPKVTAVRLDPLEDYHQLAGAFAWPERLTSLPTSADGHAHVLDVGCGTGRWLRVLHATFPELATGAARHVRYSMLDPVQPAIDTVAEVASTMFTVDRSWNAYVQNAPLPSAHFGLMWAMHSLYGVPVHDLPDALKHMTSALHPQGTAIIALPDHQSFYIQAAEQLLGHTVFTSADDVRAALDALGLRYQVRHVRYEECIPAADERALAHYVWMESIGNTYLPGGAHDDLPGLPTGPWWDSHRRGDVFAFGQNVEVILIAGGQ